MAHYIDLCKVKIVSEKFFDENEDALISVGDVRRALLMAPVEDVVPRAEVAREIFEELIKEANLRFDGFRNTIVFPLEYYCELKKKYTEGQK